MRIWLARFIFPLVFLSIMYLSGSGCNGHSGEAVMPDPPANAIVRPDSVSAKAGNSALEDDMDQDLDKPPEKVAMSLGNDIKGYIVKLSGGREVFLSYDCYEFGKYDVDKKRLQVSKLLKETAANLPGWRMVDQRERRLLDEACLAFSASDNVPYACMRGGWARPEADQDSAPVISRGGKVENARVDDKYGLMFVRKRSDQ